MVETYQKAAPIWLPCHPGSRLVPSPKRTNSHIYNGQGRTYTLAGLKVNLEGRGSQHESMAERVGSQGGDASGRIRGITYDLTHCGGNVGGIHRETG